jgi:hypothetical protein
MRRKALKGEQHLDNSSSWSQPSGGEEELSPFNSIKRPNWFEMTLRDTHEQVEVPKSTFRESEPPNKFPNFVVQMSSIIDFDSSSV